MTATRARRWLVTGAGGMLGRDLVAVLGDDQSATVTAAGRSELDVTDPEQVQAAVDGHDVVVNAAAWTDVDGAESNEPQAHRVNATGPRHLAEACKGAGATLIHVSTDYVFAGDATSPYAEEARPAPRSAYGRTKAAGERAVLEWLPERGYVVRTAWLYGEHGRSFVSTMRRLERERPTLDVVDDQRGQPTWSLDLAGALVRLGRSGARPGVYHATGIGETTWFGLARAVFELIGADPERVRPTTTAAFPRPACRPAYSVLGHERWRDAGLPPLLPWREALAQALPLLDRRSS